MLAQSWTGTWESTPRQARERVEGLGLGSRMEGCPTQVSNTHDCLLLKVRLLQAVATWVLTARYVIGAGQNLGGSRGIPAWRRKQAWESPAAWEMQNWGHGTMAGTQRRNGSNCCITAWPAGCSQERWASSGMKEARLVGAPPAGLSSRLVGTYVYARAPVRRGPQFSKSFS